MSAPVEQATLMGATPPLVGVVTRPPASATAPSGTGVIILGAGLVHRVGPNRLTVQAARRLAARGYVVARFDHRGIGDSGPRRDTRPFVESAVEETQEVMEHLTRHHGVGSFVVMGICSGAETALRTACADRRVTGVGLINGGGQGYGAAWDAYEYVRGEARQYVKRSLFSLDSWWRALTGRIQYRRLLVVMARQLRNRIAPPKVVVEASRQVASEVRGVLDRGTRILWLQSEGDFSQDYFDTMFGREGRALLDTGRVRLETIPYTDHTLTDRHSQIHVLETLDAWLDPTQAPAASPLQETRP